MGYRCATGTQDLIGFKERDIHSLAGGLHLNFKDNGGKTTPVLYPNKTLNQQIGYTDI
jgi:hypothetical protein